MCWGLPSAVSYSIKRFMNYRLPSAFGKGIYNLFTKRLRAASSRSSGLLVAPIINMREFSPPKELAPSNYTKNSVFIRLEDSISLSFLEHSKESISSIKTTVG